MNINKENLKSTKCDYDDIEIGNIFEYKGYYYIKIADDKAFDIENHEIDLFGINVSVVSLNHEIILYP